MSYSKMILRSGHHVLDGGRWVMSLAHLRRLGIPYWVKTLRKSRAIRNGRYLTRAHIFRRPRAFHPVRVGDVVKIWNWDRGYTECGIGAVDAVMRIDYGFPSVRIGGSWFTFAQTKYTGYTYVH